MRSGLGALLLVVAAGVAVGVASGGVQILMPPIHLVDGWRWGVRAVGAAVALAGGVALAIRRRRLRSAGVERPDPAVVGLRTAATIMVAVALLALFNPPPPSSEGQGPAVTFGLIEVSPFGTEEDGGEGNPSRTRGGESAMQGRAGYRPDAPTIPQGGTPWGQAALRRATQLLPWAFFLAAAVLIVARLVQRLRTGREEEATDELRVDAEAMGAALASSLVDVEEGGESPGDQITRAYLRLLDTLARAGAPRARQEAPHEHLNRALGSLGVRSEPLHRLAGLFVLAQFSGGPVTDAHRRAAADALAESLEQLQARPLVPGR